MILKLNRESHVPIYSQIAQQIKSLVAEGTLKSGDQIPPSRELARTLGVHRTTVGNAYAELQAEGIIDSHVGRGTFIAAAVKGLGKGVGRPRERVQFSPLFWNALFASDPEEDRLHSLIHLQHDDRMISFAYALPPTDLYPLDDISRCFNRVLRREGRRLLQMGESLGYGPLREDLAERMALAGMRVKAAEVLITNGCQQSLDLIRRVLISPGDVVVIENPTYPGVFTVFSGPDTKCISVPVRENGLDLNALEDVLSLHRAKLIYTVPTFQNPTGATMDLAARRRLLELALKHRVPIVEDDIYGDLRYDGPSLPSLKAMDEHGVVIYVNSFSKVGFPGLRVGWIAAPPMVIERLRRAKQSCDLHTNLLAQAALYELSRRGVMSKHLKRVRQAYAERRDIMLEAIGRYFPEGTQWSRPEGGMCVWVTLPPSLDARHLLSLAAHEGVIFSPGEIFYVHAPQPSTMRLTFTMMDGARIEAGIRRLARLVKRQLDQARVRPSRVEPAACTALV